MFAESAGLPFASMIVFLTAGTMILRGSVSFWSIFAASTIGITLGSIFSYYVGLLGSLAGRAVKNSYFHLTHNRIATKKHSGKSRMVTLWDKYGNFSIFMAQLWGFTRTFGSFPAGAMHVNFFLFLFYTFLGGALFSLMSITLSIVLTSAMSLILNLMKQLANLSPLLLSLPILLLLLIIYFFFNGAIKNFWQRLRRFLKQVLFKIRGR